ncbi:MAG: alpha/beta fold hydrolase [Myxococcales bacterium]|nr:alpha/beta fold hydrolase [Myxococcales bacterium]
MKIETSGAEIHLREQGEGDPLVLIHGLGMSGALWRNQVDLFSENFRTIAVDLRGFGESSRPAETGSYAIDRLAEDIADVARALELPPCHVLGTSMGGFVAQALALAHPEVCRSLLLCHTGPRMSIPPDVLAARIDALRTKPLEEYAELVIGQALAPGASPELVAWVRDMIVRNDKRAYTQVLTEGLSAFDLSHRVAEISAPTLVVIGELDGVIPPEEGRELAREIPGAILVEIAGVGHLGYAEKPAAFNEAILRFLRSL